MSRRASFSEVYGTLQIHMRAATVVQPEKHCFFSSAKSLACWELWRKYSSEGWSMMLSSIILFLGLPAKYFLSQYIDRALHQWDVPWDYYLYLIIR